MRADRPLLAPETLERARTLVATLRQRADECEKSRQCPPDSIADMVEAGLLRICQPARFGGSALGWDVLCEVARILAHGCASQAWVNHILNDHVHLLGIFPDRAQRDVWAENPEARISASLDPVGQARRVPGGVVYSGRHRFASGIDHAQWLFCGGRIAGDEKPTRRWFFLLPKSAVEIIDDWHVVGLAGTGSKSFVVEALFVPEHRIMDSELSSTGRGPGQEADPAPVFRMPRADFASSATGAVLIGTAEAFLAEFVAFTRARRSHAGHNAALMGTQIGVGAAAAEIEAAAHLCLDPVRQAMRKVEGGGKPSSVDLKHARLNSAFAAQLALSAVRRLFNAAGANALFASNVLQRQLRDIYAAAAHHSLTWDTSAAGWGAYLLEQGSGAPPVEAPVLRDR